jgi:hypothetical protein
LIYKGVNEEEPYTTKEYNIRKNKARNFFVALSESEKQGIKKNVAFLR